MHLLKIIEVLNAKTTHTVKENPIISHLLTDSRKSSNPTDSLFIAIKGERHDGHNYIQSLIQKGFRFFLVSDEYKTTDVDSSIVYLKVKSPLDALQKLALYKRSIFQSPVIGITGSNGKTIVKEWLHHMLSQKHAIIKSPKSYNSQLGVPLSIWPLNHKHSAGIFEAGISEKGEMNKLAKIIAPTQGIITNIGSAHDEGFESREQKLKEKLLLFQDSKYVVYRKDHKMIDQHINNNQYHFTPISWSTQTEDTDYMITFSKKKEQGESHITIWKESISWNFSLPFTDAASLENITHCIVLCLHQGLSFYILQERLSNLQPVDMRMEILAGVNNCHLINDAYNNDLIGLKMALDFSSQQFMEKKHSLILSDFLETGVSKPILLSELEKLLTEYELDKVIGIGPMLRDQKFITHSWNSTKEFLQSEELNLLFDEEVILIKGARKFSFEKIVAELVQKKHLTELTINLDAVAHNLNYYRSKLKEGTKLLAMVKAFGYGSGSHEIAHLLQYQQVDYLGVAYTDEGISLRKAGVHLPILVLNSAAHEFDRLVEYKLEPEIYSIKQLKALISFTTKKKTSVNIHIKIDTGMHRLGFLENQIDDLVHILQSAAYLNVVGIFSHMAASEDHKEDTFSRRQITLFKKITGLVEKKLNKTLLKHMVNSSGISRFPEAHFDMVRLGIGMYGISSVEKEQQNLEVVGRLTSSISQIKLLTKGETVGYNRKGKITKDIQKIGIVPIGYADGYDRRLGNGVGNIFVNGAVTSTIGSICMDMSMIDLTNIDAKEGDLVEFFGENIKISDLAVSINTCLLYTSPSPRDA